MKVKSPVPREKALDSTLSLIKEGFNYIPSRREQLGSDIFETRIVGKKAVCIAGEESAAIFYDENKFKRKGAIPKPLMKSLLGEGGVHEQDEEAHRQRKRMHLSMMTPERLEDMRRIAIKHLDKKVCQWEKEERVNLFEEMVEIFTRAGCEWAGVPLKEKEVKQRSREVLDMIDSFGGSPARFRQGAKARSKQEKWLTGIIKEIRAEKFVPPSYTPAYIIAHHREPNGKRLDPQVAAVDLSNTFRPLVATAYFMVFGAVAMHEYPQVHQKLKEDTDGYSKMFAQEVRRFYPFAPAMAAKVKQDFLWNDYKFKKNTLVILDLFGTNRHPDSWEQPNQFIPERFKNWKESPCSVVPQGGGNHYMGHRCAGECMTVMVMTFEVPDQDLSYDMSRMPTLPKSGFEMTNIRKLKEPSDELYKKMDTQTAIKV